MADLGALVRVSPDPCSHEELRLNTGPSYYCPECGLAFMVQTMDAWKEEVEREMDQGDTPDGA